MERAKKPASIPINPASSSGSGGQPNVTVEQGTVTASLHSGDSVAVNLFGATVTSWKTGGADGGEQLFLSQKAVLDGSKAVRGGIPVVFPVFGPPPANHATSSLPQHGFARSTFWEYLGKSASESSRDDNSDSSVKLDFGLSSSMLRSTEKGAEFAKAWPYEFGLVYSVSLGKGWLGTTLQVQNSGSTSFEFQALLHTYFKVEDISRVRIQNLESKTYIDKTNNASTATETNTHVPITGETDRVYQSLDPTIPIIVSETDAQDVNGHKTLFSITRESLPDMVVWNPWATKARDMSDFAPDDGYKSMVCVEPGAVSGWQTLEGHDTWEAGQKIRSRM